MQNRPLIERLARHLASTEPDQWPSRLDDAASILALLKEPDNAMREVGAMEIWTAMIDAALRERWSASAPVASTEPPAGADEEGEIRLPRDAVGSNHADWVHLETKKEIAS